ncbi:TonB-dependent receptor [Parvularcula sp. LCG005]|uniref:TonB-dependent receptor n=1 Tax=Parvularcula sp. LCG005 TaxID=3078805 RepID=UPI0029421B1D|nr:TonB-dependent receptor [Parvularcula sp. LCG005]WOI53064.1 TonB-dependent receptor [Parvularcula sp. LCG005]
MPHKTSVSTFALTAIAAAGLHNVALAQDQIVVTALRQPNALLDTPVSISVIDRDAIDRIMPHHPAELINIVPGANVQAGSGQEHLTAIRSPVLTGGAGAGSFLYLQDGVPLRSAGFANVNGLFDAQTDFARRVEVIRGPGDVTYGSNAVHGSINVLSPDPLTADGAEMRLSAGAFERRQATLSGGGSGLFGGLNVYSDGGYRDDSGVLQVKGQLAHAMTRGNWTGRTRLSFHHLEQETAGYVEGPSAYREDALRRSNPNPEAYRDIDLALLSSEWQWSGDRMSATITPYALWTEMEFKMHFLPSQAVESNDHRAMGVLSTFVRPLGPLTELVFGADLETAQGSLTEVQDIPTVFSYVQGVHYDYDVTAQSAAPFARIDHQLTEGWRVQLGGRYTYTAYDYDNHLEDGRLGRFIRVADRSDDFGVWTAKLSTTYDLGDRTALFASLSRGARPPQTTDLYRLQLSQTAEDIEPETLDMAEWGIRHDGQRLYAELVAFAGRKENFLFRDADGFNVTDGVTTHRGLEADLRWRATETLTLSAGGTLAKHRYDFTRIVGIESEIIRSGSAVDTAPETVARAAVQWMPVPALSTSLSISHVGAYFTDAANENTYPGHEVVDLQAAYQLSDRVRLSGVVKNLLDERYATRADYAFGSERYFPGEERHGIVTLEVGF